MGRKQIVAVCNSCESPLRADSPFCPGCGRPTGWATYDERVAWEVRQWRSSRAREGQATTTMMLVRTETGYVPSPMRPDDQYVWNQPLHPEREAAQVAARPSPAPPKPMNGNGHANGNGHSTVLAEPEAPDAAIIEVEAEVPAVEPEELGSVTPPQIEPAEAPLTREVRVSKKAVGVALLLVVALPLGGKVIGLGRSKHEAAMSSVSAAAARVTAEAGLVQQFVVRGTRMTRNGSRVVVRASVSGTSAVRRARVVIVFVDRAGKIVGGRFASIDVPSPPRAAALAVSASNVPRSAQRAEVYVVSPR